MSYSASRRRRKAGSRSRGSILVETTIAMIGLTVLSLVMFKATLNVLRPRQWAIVQQLTDAYLTYEVALAERVPFEELVGADSLWPVFPETAEEERPVGQLPGGHNITGTIYRTRERFTEHDPTPEEIELGIPQMETWKVQSHLKYRLGGVEYVKSRTVVRTR